MLLVLRHLVFSTLLFASLLFISCGDDSGTNPDDTDITEQVQQEISIQSERTPDNGQITIDSVTALQTGWIVIHPDNGSNAPIVPGVIGKARIDSGITTLLSIRLDSVVVNGEILWAMLHADDGQVGVYEFDGIGTHDQPIMQDSIIVMTRFAISQTDPRIEIDEQLPINNSVLLRRVHAAENGWVVIHANDDGIPGAVLAMAPVVEGVTLDVSITLPTDSTWLLTAGDSLWATLHYDRGVEGSYEFPGVDSPVQLQNGEIVTVPFLISQPDMLSITVNDQEIVEKTILVDEIITEGPGWITVQRDNGQGGPISTVGIGHTQVFAGKNTSISISLDQSVSKGGRLWIVLHDDDGQRGVYEFPDFDLPVFVDGNKVLASFLVQ